MASIIFYISHKSHTLWALKIKVVEALQSSSDSISVTSSIHPRALKIKLRRSFRSFSKSLPHIKQEWKLHLIEAFKALDHFLAYEIRSQRKLSSPCTKLKQISKTEILTNLPSPSTQLKKVANTEWEKAAKPHANNHKFHIFFKQIEKIKQFNSRSSCKAFKSNSIKITVIFAKVKLDIAVQTKNKDQAPRLKIIEEKN